MGRSNRGRGWGWLLAAHMGLALLPLASCSSPAHQFPSTQAGAGQSAMNAEAGGDAVGEPDVGGSSPMQPVGCLTGDPDCNSVMTMGMGGAAGAESLGPSGGTPDILGEAGAGGAAGAPPAGPICGDGKLDPDERCDDGGTAPDDGCNAICRTESGWLCDAGEPTHCTVICGDGLLVGPEAQAGSCDDNNMASLDGCSAACKVETGYVCSGQPSVCAKTCGDGKLDAGEACDDKNLQIGDGCTACAVESGFGCDNAQLPSKCSDINECTANTDNCSANAACTNTTGAFTCKCNNGYSGDGVTCTDINECTANTDNCSANAACTNTTGAFTCKCNDGYSGNGVTCTDINECTANTDNCSANAACTNTTGAFTCKCNNGYSGDGVSCSDIDECTANTDNCSADAACTNTTGAFTCKCNNGYSGNGVTCADVDECTANTDNCNAHAACANTTGSFTCSCNSGYAGDGVTCTAKPSITSFTADYVRVCGGGGVTFNATFKNGTATIDHGVGSIASGGAAASGNISAKTVFTLTVVNAGAPSATATVTVDTIANGTFALTKGSSNIFGAFTSLALRKLKDGRVLVFGTPLADTGSVQIFDPHTETFAPTAVTPTQYPAIAPLNNGRALFAGGDGTTTSSVYDPALNTVVATGGLMIQPRLLGATVLLSSGKVLLSGGLLFDEPSSSYSVLKGSELYDPTAVANGSFSAGPDMNSARWGEGVAFLPSTHKVLLAGGCTGYSDTTGCTGIVTSADLFDPTVGKAGTFLKTGPMTTSRIAFAIAALSDDHVLVAGGKSAGVAVKTAELYDPQGGDPLAGIYGSFALTGAMSVTRSGASATLLANGKVLVAGGDATGSAEIYDLQTAKFTSTGSLNFNRSGHEAVLLDNGMVLIGPDNTELYCP